MKAVSKSHLFHLMRETAAEADALIMGELAASSRDIPGIAEAIRHLPEVRLGGRTNPRPKVRAVFVRLIFELLSDADWHRVLPVAAVGELLAISSYVIDDLLDHQQIRESKPATWVVFTPEEAIIAAQLQREIAEKILLRVPLDEKRAVRLVQSLNEIFYRGYLGQWIDSRMTKPCRIEEYIKRCEHIAGHFHAGLARMAAIIADAPADVTQRIWDLAFAHGIALQIRNDLVDYIPVSITAQAGARALERDHFEDFRNGKWTLPLLHAYERATRADKERVEGLLKVKRLSEVDAGWLTRLLLSTGAYERTLDTITAYKEQAETLLLELGERPARETLLLFLECIENSRSYVQSLRVRGG